MNTAIDEALEELKEEETIDDWECLDCAFPTKEETQFANAFHNMLQSLIAEQESLTEEFVSKYQLKKHYNEHCIADKPNRKSRRQNVFYDFTNIDKYRLYENELLSAFLRTPLEINNLYDMDIIIDYMKKLFEGNTTIRFLLSCDFVDDNGNPVQVGLYAFSTNKTTNYSNGNTISLLVVTPNNKTITLYAVDANYLENKFNNVIKTHTLPQKDVKLKFNH